MAEPPSRGRRGVAARLAVAFVAVALVAVALFAVLTVVVESRDVSGLARSQANDLAGAVAGAAAGAYRSHEGWAGADLSDAMAVAGAVGADVEIADVSGRVVASGPGTKRPSGTSVTSTAPVEVTGRRVGEVRLAIGAGGLGRTEAHLRHALALGLAGSAAAAALLAVGAAVIVAERIARPVAHLTAAARAMSAGRRDVRVGALSGPRELAELGEAYDAMAATVAEEDRLRRATAAHVAHELRTPVAIILATCESLLDGVHDPSPENLSSLRDEALRLAARVADVETLASAEAAGLSLHREPVDLAQVAKGAADALAERFAAADVGLDRHLTSVWTLGDAGRLHQVVTNLLTNAVKFSPEGSAVEIRSLISDGDAVLEVSDSGPGITPDEISHLSEPFWRGRAAASVAGSGIGLAVVDQLVTAHGGRVEVDSVPGRGTTFRVRLPQVAR